MKSLFYFCGLLVAMAAFNPICAQDDRYKEARVLHSEAVSGHPLLRAAARSAACEAKFTPTFLEGKPVKVSGIITYNFVP